MTARELWKEVGRNLGCLLEVVAVVVAGLAYYAVRVLKAADRWMYR